MLKMDFNKKMKLVKGQEGATLLSELLAFVLAQVQNSSNPVKLWNWAVKANDGKPLEMDKADAEFLRDVLMKTELLVVSGKAQLIEIIDEAIKAGEK